jgi:hypothetical protein
MVHLYHNIEETGELRGGHSRKKVGLVIGKILVSIRGSEELRFFLKKKVPKVRTYG